MNPSQWDPTIVTRPSRQSQGEGAVPSPQLQAPCPLQPPASSCTGNGKCQPPPPPRGLALGYLSSHKRQPRAKRPGVGGHAALAAGSAGGWRLAAGCWLVAPMSYETGAGALVPPVASGGGIVPLAAGSHSHWRWWWWWVASSRPRSQIPDCALRATCHPGRVSCRCWLLELFGVPESHGLCALCVIQTIQNEPIADPKQRTAAAATACAKGQRPKGSRQPVDSITRQAQM
jgi:hypothetical protein